MRIPHCTVALAIVATVAVPGYGQTQPSASQPVDFTVFVQGTAVGAEQVTVTRTPEGILISGSERIGPPLNIVSRKAELTYSADWKPLGCVLEGSVGDQQVLLRTVITGTAAANAIRLGVNLSDKTDQIAADAILLPNMFFGSYEALAARLAGAKAGDVLQAYIPPQGPMTITVKSVTDDRFRTQTDVVAVRRYALDFASSGRGSEVELWNDAGGRLVRLSVAAQGFDVVRKDVASITARREQAARPNDERVQIPANGFSLAGTISQPAAKPSPNWRYPAIVLVAGSDPTDRDETTAGIPVFAELASALADAGYLVLRYDKRGVGQSGGRQESATVSDLADDAIAALRLLERRGDVSPKRIAVLGYGEGGAPAATAAARTNDIAALVLVASPGVTGAALALEQQRHLLSLMKLSDEEKQKKIELQVKLQKAVMAGYGFEGIPDNIRKQADTPWFQSFLAWDPAKGMKKIDQPVLVVHGELDRQIDPSNADKIAALARARKGRAGEAVKLVKLPGINHLLIPAKTGEVDEYERLPDRRISNDAVAAVAAWLVESMKAR
jgi:uncharacterized protein